MTIYDHIELQELDISITKPKYLKENMSLSVFSQLQNTLSQPISPCTFQKCYWIYLFLLRAFASPCSSIKKSYFDIFLSSLSKSSSCLPMIIFDLTSWTRKGKRSNLIKNVMQWWDTSWTKEEEIYLTQLYIYVEKDK